MSDAPNLFDDVRSVLGSDSRFIVVGTDMLHCDGSAAPLTNIYPVETAADEWKDWRPGAGGMPNPERMSSLIFETRSATWVAEVGLLLAQGLEARTWFVDSADVAWPVGEVDPSRIALA